MRMAFALVVAGALAMLGGTGAQAFPVPVDIDTYTFTGVCAENDCSGSGTATILLKNYTQGTALNDQNFVSFDYHSSIFPLPAGLHADSSDVFSLSGNIPNGLPSPSVNFQLAWFAGGNFFSFQTFAEAGNWSLQETELGILDDFGPSYVFDAAAVPGPMVGAGLPGLVMAAGALLAWRRRKQNQLAA
jgi:hypothetical protein